MLKKIGKLIIDNKILLLVLLLASVLRFSVISKVPPSLNWDEVSHGYNAYSILKTGKDEWGVLLPTIFRAYGDYKLPVYIYITAISEEIFGLSAFAVRIPSVLAGIVTVFFTYLLVIELLTTKNRSPVTDHRTLATIAALLVAAEPWTFFLSRGAFEANLALAFFVAGVYFFLKGVHNSKFYFYASVLLGLTVWTYNSYRIFTPLMILVLIVIYRKPLSNYYKNKSTIFLSSLFILLFFLLPMFWQLVANPAGQARYDWVAIIDEGAVAQINEARNNSSLNNPLPRLIHNKVTFVGARFIGNYISHFTPSFLFVEGGTHYQFSVPQNGLIYHVNAPFLLLGIYFLLKRRDSISYLLLAWFLLAPIPSSLTREAPHVLRAITFLPAPMIATSLGLITTFKWLKSKFTSHQSPVNKHFFTAVYLIILTGFTELYFANYFVKYRQNYSWSWQFGYKQVVDYTKENYDKYDKIIVTKKYGEPHEFFLFFWPWDPESYINDPKLIRFYQSNWYWVDAFDKFYFVNDWQVPTTDNEDFVLESGESVKCTVDGVRCLLITSVGNTPQGWKKLETINFLDGQPAFEIYKN